MAPRQGDPGAAKETGTRAGTQRGTAGGQPGAGQPGMHSDQTCSADKFAAKECLRDDSWSWQQIPKLLGIGLYSKSTLLNLNTQLSKPCS